MGQLDFCISRIRIEIAQAFWNICTRIALGCPSEKWLIEGSEDTIEEKEKNWSGGIARALVRTENGRDICLEFCKKSWVLAASILKEIPSGFTSAIEKHCP